MLFGYGNLGIIDFGLFLPFSENVVIGDIFGMNIQHDLNTRIAVIFGVEIVIMHLGINKINKLIFVS